MHVDLGDYKFITLKASTSDKINFITYIISKGSNIGYVQLNAYGKSLSKKNNSKTNKGFNDNWIPNFNDLKGSIILQGLRFKTGSSDITDANIKILSSLANYLILNDSEKIILVGHTDASGGLKNNIMLSKERAESVKNLFVAQFNVNPDQIATNGVGFLAPIASNETEKGRDQNRRVEVIIMPTLN
jgi:OOP family OmpA-OmpF porin